MVVSGPSRCVFTVLYRRLGAQVQAAHAHGALLLIPDRFAVVHLDNLLWTYLFAYPAFHTSVVQMEVLRHPVLIVELVKIPAALLSRTCAEVPGDPVGDPSGYEESLYKTEDGKYFLYVNGGAESIYPKEDIKRLSAAKAEEWKAAKGI